MPKIMKSSPEEALDERWALWFAGMDLRPAPSGGALLSGSLPDKAALHSPVGPDIRSQLTLVGLRRLRPLERK